MSKGHNLTSLSPVYHTLWVFQAKDSSRLVAMNKEKVIKTEKTFCFSTLLEKVFIFMLRKEISPISHYISLKFRAIHCMITNSENTKLYYIF